MEAEDKRVEGNFEAVHCRYGRGKASSVSGEVGEEEGMVGERFWGSRKKEAESETNIKGKETTRGPSDGGVNGIRRCSESSVGDAMVDAPFHFTYWS